MKTIIKTFLAVSALATSAMAQVVTPVWVEHLNGQQGVAPADRLPILVKNLGAYENNNGQSAQISLGKLLPYDSTKLLLYVRENGIDESQPHDANISNAFPDRSLIWIDAATGKPLILPGHSNAVAITWGAIPIAITGQGSPYDFFSEWGLDEDKNIYLGHKNKIIRFAKLPGQDAWSNIPTCAWTEPTSGASDCNGNALDGSSNGDGNSSMRWREFRVTGKGVSTVLFAGGGTWRMESNPQIFTTTNGFDFAPVGRLDNRDNGAGKNSYALGGQSTHVIKYAWDSSRPNLETVYTGHYPGAGYGNRPNRYESDPDAPAYIIDSFSYSGNADGSVRVLHREETSAGESQPAFAWEAAGTHGLPETVPIDGDQYYDGNWSCAIDGNASLDYIVNYSMPSWNNQYPVISGTNYHKPGWIGVHRLDGSIALNSAWKLPCTEDDIANSDNGGVGNDFGYTGDVTVIPDTTAPANLKKATVFWSGGAYGFGVFTVQNVPAAVTTALPASVTVIEGQTLSLTSAFSGSPNTYTWSLAGTPLDGTTLNVDNSVHYPATVVQGVSTPNLVVTPVAVADSGTYSLTVTNPLSGTHTYNVSVTVLPDTNKPTVVSVTALGTPNTAGAANPYLVKVLFSKHIDTLTGANQANYSIPGVTVLSANVQTDVRGKTLGADWREVILQTSGLTPGTKYTLTVSGVTDQASTPNTIVPAPVSFKAPVLTTGGLTFDYYYMGASASISTLLGSGIFPISTWTNATLSAFDSTLFTGGDLNNNPAFGALGDQYGASISGWITPTVTTNYVFFLASDDGSQLNLSTDSTPGNVTTIAEETSCCHGFQEPGALTTSSPIPLIAGHSYYVQALHAEGGGGDYVKVAWRMDGDTTAATSLSPIPGQYLSSFAAIPLPSFGQPVLANGVLTLPWSAYQNQATLQESADLKTWTAVVGNPNPLVVNVKLAPKKFYRLLQQ